MTRLTLTLTILFTAVFLLLSGVVHANPFEINKLVGQQAPEFSLQDINGNRVALADLRGKVVLLNFWALWCPPCLQEFPSFVKLKNSMKGQPFEMVTIAIDSPLRNIKAFAEKKGANFPVLYDPKKEASSRYHVFSLPTTFLIDKNGRIVEKFFGAHEWDSEQMKDKIRRLF